MTETGFGFRWSYGDDDAKGGGLGIARTGYARIDGRLVQPTIRRRRCWSALCLPRPTRRSTAINWRCTGDKCVGTPVGRKSPGSRMDECRKVAAALGKLSSFSSRGKELTKRDLDSCNRGAR